MNHPKSCRYRQAVFIGSETEHETQYGVFCCFKLSKCQFLRSLKTSTIGNRPSRHGLAAALNMISQIESLNTLLCTYYTINEIDTTVFAPS